MSISRAVSNSRAVSQRGHQGLLLILCAGATWLEAATQQTMPMPAPQDAQIQQWIAELKGDDPVKRTGAQAKLVQLRGAAVPALIKVLREPEPKDESGALIEGEIIPETLEEALGRGFGMDATLDRVKLPPESLLPHKARAIKQASVPDPSLKELDQNAGVHARAIATLQQIGEPALPALGEALERAATAELATRALLAIGEPALPHMLARLQHADQTVRIAALEVLARLGARLPNDRITALLALLGNEDSNLREHAAWVLMSQPEDVAPVLIGALDQASTAQRERIVGVLALMGRHVHPVVPQLTALLQHKQPRVRQWAARALLGAELIGDERKAMLAELMKLANDQDGGVHITFIEALITLGKEVPGSGAHIRAALKHKNPHVRLVATRLLPRTGSSPIEMLASLELAMEDRTDDVRRIAIYLLGRQGEAGLKPLADAVRERNRVLFRDITAALGSIGPVAAEKLIELSGKEDRELRVAAVHALGLVGAKSPDVAPALQKLLLDEDEPTRLAAAEACGAFREQPKRVVPGLVVALRDASFKVRQKAAASLGALGPGASAAVPTLMTLLADEDDEIKVAAIQALGGIGAASQAARHQLDKLGEEGSAEVRTAVKEARGAIERSSARGR